MKLQITIKQLGKKRPIGTSVIEISNFNTEPTLKDLITNVVKQQVSEFNKKHTESAILPFITKQEIDDQSQTGKVGFGAIYNDNKANENEAIENAILAFTDGLFCVFIDDNQIENLDEKITITEKNVVSFVRLTFLAGSYW